MPFRRAIGTLACAGLVLTGCAPTTLGPQGSPPLATSARAVSVMKIVDEVMKSAHLRAVIVRVTQDGKEIATRAAGESMTGVPASTDMHFRNGAVAISYVATLLFRLVDEGRVHLDDKLSTWLPEIPHSDQVTLRQLAQMTSGYVDYVIGNTDMNDALYANPFRQWTTQELLDFAVHQPLQYQPGTNWNYSHTNYVLLGLALEKAVGEPMSKMLSENVLQPLGLTSTANSETAEIPAPVLHAFTSERRAALRIPDGMPFDEESTYWNPSWTITHGAIQTSNIYDLEATAVGIGSGKLLSRASYEQMVSTALRGKTRAQPGCATCAPMTDGYTYGLGLVISGGWLLQNPMFAGYSAVEAYLPARKIAIAVAATFDPEAFDGRGDYSNGADVLFRRIGAELAPDQAPPVPPAK